MSAGIRLRQPRACGSVFTWRMGHRWPATTAAVVALALFAACGGSDYEYVSNRAERVFFKVPDSWVVFDSDELLEEELIGGWLRGFSGGDRAEPGQVFVSDAAIPRGYAYVLPLSAEERDTMSFATLRSTNFGTDADGVPIDPLAFVTANPDGPITVLDYDELDQGHARGIHIRVRIEQEGSVALIDQTVMVDAGTSRRYLLTLGCRLACWDAHERELEGVVASWTVKARS